MQLTKENFPCDSIPKEWIRHYPNCLYINKEFILDFWEMSVPIKSDYFKHSIRQERRILKYNDKFYCADIFIDYNEGIDTNYDLQIFEVDCSKKEIVIWEKKSIPIL